MRNFHTGPFDAVNKETLEYRHHLATFKGRNIKFESHPTKLVEWMNEMRIKNRVENGENGAFNLVYKPKSD